MEETSANRALLPTGLRDLLPPDAAFEAGAAEAVLALFADHGYERIKPPLIEFADSLLTGPGAALANQTFRVMDPLSQQLMGVRADITVQAARIAGSRLAHAPRPLRLSYAGQVLRVKGDQLRPERQFAQAGLELIGSSAPLADVEAMTLAVDALALLGVEGVTLDVGLPRLVPIILRERGVDGPAAAALADALHNKDGAAVAAAGGPAADLLAALLAAEGPAEPARDALSGLTLPAPAAEEMACLKTVLAALAARRPELAVTVDLVEHRGHEYHAGVSFALFARGQRGELGRGGRYMAGAGGEQKEPAVGASLFLDAVLRGLSPPAARPRLYLPPGEEGTAAALQAEGWVTMAGLDPAADPAAEARRLGCDHWVSGGRPVPVDKEGTD